MELREYIRVVAKSWWIIIPLIFIALTVSLVFSYSRTPIYEASATYITRLEVTSGADPGTQFFGIETMNQQRLFTTYCETMTSLRVREEAFTLVGIALTPELLETYEVVCTNLPETNVLLVRVQGPSPPLVLRLSEAIGIVGMTQTNNLYSFFPLERLDPVKLAENQVSPKITQNAVLGGALGLIVGVGLAFLLEYFRSPMERLEGRSIRHLQLGTYNERYFRERFEQEIDRASARNRPITMAIMRLDPREDFDIYPEVAQFKLLRAVATMMQTAVHQRNLVASLQLRTFGFLLAETSGDEALEVFKHIHEDLQAQSFEADGYITNFEATTGLVTGSGGELTYKSMLDKTFVALDVAEEKENRIYLVRTTPRPFDDSPMAVEGLPFGNIEIPDEDSAGAQLWSTSRPSLSASSSRRQAVVDADIAPDKSDDLGSLNDWLGTSSSAARKETPAPASEPPRRSEDRFPAQESAPPPPPQARETPPTPPPQPGPAATSTDDQNFILGKVFNNITENLIPKSQSGKGGQESDKKE